MEKGKQKAENKGMAAPPEMLWNRLIFHVIPV